MKLGKPIDLTLTQRQAEQLGIVFCECGHPPNNHFDLDKNACGHCACQEYRQVIKLPKR